MNNKFTGKVGENLAVNYLKKSGYRIIETNFSCKLGEIDIIAKDGKTLCFVEVKFRQNDFYGSPLDAVDKRKVSKITKTAQYYCLINHIKDVPLRIDVVGVVCNKDKTDVVLIKNAIMM